MRKAAKKLTAKQRHNRTYYLAQKERCKRDPKFARAQRKKQRDYYLANKERFKSNSRKHYLANREEVIARLTAYKKKRMQNDPEFARRERVRRRACTARWKKTPAGRESRRRLRLRRIKRMQDALAIVRSLGIKL